MKALVFIAAFLFSLPSLSLALETGVVTPVPAATPSSKFNPHVVGWANTFVPGLGQLLLDDPLLGAAQFSLEVSTFWYGYSLSPRTTMTLDGVPESLEVANSKSSRSCLKTTTSHGKTTCTKWGAPVSTGYSTAQVDNFTAGYADILQEFGLKYHMVNVFNSYREAAGTTELGQGIDQHTTKELFLAPFDGDTMTDPYVYAPLLLLAGFTVRDYFQSVHSGVPALQPMTPYSNQLLAFNYEIWQPIGSGAPEEMFYRGFLQNELYQIVPSPYFSIPMSTLAFSFSHAPQGRMTAAVAGAYLGYLANRYHGNLNPGIAVHFWTVLMLGIETIALTDKAQGYPPLRFVSVVFDL